MTTLSDYLVSLIRTCVAVAVGAACSWAVRHGFDIDSAEATAYVTPLAIAGYYALVRTLEKRWPKLGWLFGVAKQPAYPSPA